MPISRYAFTPLVKEGRLKGTSTIHNRIRRAVRSNNISYTATFIKERQRLDHIAANIYGHSSLWWIIAAASDIGWGLQVPPGTILRIPTDLGQIVSMMA